MERLWLIVSMLCVMAAALLLWRAQVDEAYGRAAFVAGALGAVAWFLRLRAQLRKTIPPAINMPADDAEENDAQDEN
ncbi:MAG: hypothetical protein QOF02_1028 [Blastocatellia bacterium]|jgi:hypothetical protein|nr:hypothetical protein [Blastocatellia bacterium]